MAVTTIPWGDGSGDNIYLTYPSASGYQTVLVSSDANAGSTDRTKTITFTASHHGTTDTKTLTVVQEGVPESYIVFADPVVGQICATNWGDGVGLKPSQAAQVTNAQFGTTFRNNTQITSFDELQYFTGLASIPQYAFSGCSSLMSITLPNSIGSVPRDALGNIASNATLNLGNGSPYTSSGSAANLRKISSVIIKDVAQLVGFFKNVRALNYGCIFGLDVGGYRLYDQNGNEITECVVPDTFTEIKACTFAYNKSLTTIDLPSTITNIGNYAFGGVGSPSAKVTYIVRATTPPTLASAFDANNTEKIYVPYGCLTAYQTATSWSSSAGYMEELNPDGTIPT